MPTTLLIAEDEAAIRDLLRDFFEAQGYAVVTAADGDEALARARDAAPDLVLLDVMMPGPDGFEVVRRLRRDGQTPVILLTARVAEMDRVVGLELGADDYVTKPFSLQEVVARIRSALRRVRTVREQMAAAPSADDEAPIVAGGLTVDPVRREVSLDGEEVHLTVREFDLLLFLARHPDRPFTRSQLLQQIWDISYEGYDRTIDSHVQRLRAKIEADAGNPTFIRTVWGVGYKFAGEENGLRSADPG